MPALIQRLARHIFHAVPPLRRSTLLFSVLRYKMESADEELLVQIDDRNRMYINFLDYVGFQIYLYGYFEEDTVSEVKARLPVGGTFFDIGAHFGQFTLVGASAVDSGAVHSFEPGPTQFAYLTRNVQLNGYKNVRLNNVALGEKEGQMGFEVGPARNLGASHLVEGPSETNVRVMALDNYCEENKIASIDALKIDVEGAELNVFKGAKNMLSQTPPKVIFYECVSSLTERFGYPPAKVHELLTSYGYQIFTLHKKKLTKASTEALNADTDFVALHS